MRHSFDEDSERGRWRQTEFVPKHYDASLAILNRTGMSERTEHTVKVEHTSDAHMVELVKRLAAEMNMPIEKLLGANHPALAAPTKLIEGEVVKLEPEPVAAGQPENRQLDPSGKKPSISPDFD